MKPLPPTRLAIANWILGKLVGLRLKEVRSRPILWSAENPLRSNGPFQKTEELYEFLAANEVFLAQGRAIGAQIAISQELHDEFCHRHGDKAAKLLANVGCIEGYAGNDAIQLTHFGQDRPVRLLAFED